MFFINFISKIFPVVKFTIKQMNKKTHQKLKQSHLCLTDLKTSWHVC